MATVTKENIGLLHEKLIVKLEKTDYLPSFEKTLKEYSKKANIPGFRKGMVPTGLIKKMYGASLFADEVLRSVDQQLDSHLQNTKLDIFAQPLPLELDMHQLDVNNPADYTFYFEVGMKPKFKLVDLGAAKTTRYVVTITDEMIDDEMAHLQNRYGNMQDQDTVAVEDNVLNMIFFEVDENGNAVENGIEKSNSLPVKYFKESFRSELMGKATRDFVIVPLDKAFDEKELEFVLSDLGLDKTDTAAVQKHFKIQITKISLLEKKELNQEFYNQLYPTHEDKPPAGEESPENDQVVAVKTETDFRNKIKKEMQAYWSSRAKNQLHDQVFHQLVDHTSIKFPEEFLKKWAKTQGTSSANAKDENVEGEKSDDQVEKEFPTFLKQLKWTLIVDKIGRENDIQPKLADLHHFIRQQLFDYMDGLGSDAANQPWVNEYVERMMKDSKYVEDAYTRIQTQKIFEWAETKVNPADKDISAEDFAKMIREHQHEDIETLAWKEYKM